MPITIKLTAPLIDTVVNCRIKMMKMMMGIGYSVSRPHSKMVLHTPDNGCTINVTGMDTRSGLMAQNMKGIGVMIRPMDMVNYSMLMVMSMRVNG